MWSEGGLGSGPSATGILDDLDTPRRDLAALDMVAQTPSCNQIKVDPSPPLTPNCQPNPIGPVILIPMKMLT